MNIQPITENHTAQARAHIQALGIPERPSEQLIKAGRACMVAKAQYLAIAKRENEIKRRVLQAGQYPSVEGGIVELPALDFLIVDERAAEYFAALDAAYMADGLATNPWLDGKWQPGYTPEGLAYQKLRRAEDALLDAVAEWSRMDVGAERCKQAGRQMVNAMIDHAMRFLAQ